MLVYILANKAGDIADQVDLCIISQLCSRVLCRHLRGLKGQDRSSGPKLQLTILLREEIPRDWHSSLLSIHKLWLADRTRLVNRSLLQNLAKTIQASTIMSKNNIYKLARKGDHQKLFQLLSQHQSSINQVQPKSGLSLLHISIQQDDQQLFKKLIKFHGIDIQLQTSQGQSPLQMSVRLNNIWMVNSLLELNVNCKKKNHQGQTVLCVALRNVTHVDILKKLTNQRIDVNQPIMPEGSYLNLAIINGHLQNFLFLINNFELDYARRHDQQNNSALILAVKSGKGDFVVSILDKVKNDPILTNLDKQFFINHQNSDGNTALHQAAIRGLQTITEKLISIGEEMGIDDQIRNKKGLTAKEIMKSHAQSRINQKEMEKKRQEERVVRKKEKNEEKIRQREQEEREKEEEKRRKREEQINAQIQAKVQGQIQKKKTIWIAGILLIIVFAGMYLVLVNAIQKKKPVTL